MNLHQIILGAVSTEKAVGLQEKRQYAFLVHKEATKTDIKKAFKEFWDADISAITVLKVPKKTRLVGRGKVRTKRQERKKVYVQFKSGSFDILKFAGATKAKAEKAEPKKTEAKKTPTTKKTVSKK